jgi:hypothetical protein
MLKFLASAALALSALPAFAADAEGAACVEKNPSGGDIRVITCALPAGGAHRLTANFGGGHDDTSASLTATLDGEATECAPDSKTKLFGEDGDVSLHCSIGVADKPRTLVVTVLFSHAWYRDFRLAAE